MSGNKLVMAGNYQQFVQYCQARNLNPRSLTYIGEHSPSWRGRRDTVLIRTGEWYRRADASEIDALVCGGYFREVRDEAIETETR